MIDTHVIRGHKTMPDPWGPFGIKLGLGGPWEPLLGTPGAPGGPQGPPGALRGPWGPQGPLGHHPPTMH